MDSGGVEVGAVGASAPAGGQHGDGKEFGECGAAATKLQSVGSVGFGAVPDVRDVGVPGESDERVDRGGGGEGVLDLGKPGAECVGAGAELGKRDGTSAKAAERSVRRWPMAAASVCSAVVSRPGSVGVVNTSVASGRCRRATMIRST